MLNRWEAIETFDKTRADAIVVHGAGGMDSERPATYEDGSHHINGKPVVADIPDNALLVDFLRTHLKLTGTKESCGIGVCGACSVILDGKPVSSCLTLAVFADGCTVETIEGVADGDELHPCSRPSSAAVAFNAASARLVARRRCTLLTSCG